VAPNGLVRLTRSPGRRPDRYDADGIGVLKLAYLDPGEIDFMCVQSIVCEPARSSDVRGQMIALETPAETVAKKVYFRRRNFQLVERAIAELSG